MMNKLLTKTTKKLSLLCLIMVVIVAAATVLTAIFGVNAATRMSDQTTVTVKMSAVYYRDDSKREAVETVCENAFEKLDVEYVYASQMSGDDCELVYVFNAKADVTAAEKASSSKYSFISRMHAASISYAARAASKAPSFNIIVPLA